MKIFISYRRVEDKSSNIVYIIHDKLAGAFGKDNVFRDTRDITPGTEWRERLDKEVNSCKVMLVVIGPDWAGLADSEGNKRLFNEKDVTRWEVETGLNRRKEENISMIPVLVMGAKLPKAEDLPESLCELSKLQALPLRSDSDLDADIEKLIQSMRKLRGFRENDLKKVKDYEPKTIYIDEGIFYLGSSPAEGIPDYETPQQEVFLPSFRIGKYPVTNKEYGVYISKKRIPAPNQIGWDGQKIRPGMADHPVVGVTWFDALAYCRWLSEQTGREYSLPNEAQWEKACRGGNKTIFPWGDDFEPQRCNQGQPALSAVNNYPAQNDYDLFDLVGNVRQWTCTLWGELQSKPDPAFAYPWNEDDQRNDVDANGQIRRVLRGSSFKSSVASMRCSTRMGQMPSSTNGYGFRIAMTGKDLAAGGG